MSSDGGLTDSLWRTIVQVNRRIVAVKLTPGDGDNPSKDIYELVRVCESEGYETIMETLDLENEYVAKLITHALLVRVLRDMVGDS